MFATGYSVEVREKMSLDSAVACDPGESVVQQQFAEECDINVIVKRFGLGQDMPPDPRLPLPDLFLDITDFHSAMNAVRTAQEGFNELPAEVRSRFANDPQRLMEFLADDKNRGEAVKLGLVVKPPEVPRDAVKAIDELAAKLAVPKAAA